ncbi:redox-sensitive transcriptional activator SoxR [Shewanella aestuarii]|uniref:Redox-sensitive transcriptional activator SoxR n=1 Tax=Shewanella aestuarii TaxID=1028752 RepID=A0A6G9QJW3_9GAMM|nr:redox-sensitive transcriptional activator SoxR [Shewanella aestuarii]QIR14423.1 redox-sensitive transcriptional activator SoxR [Shewanella aestuarii]
MQEYELTVGQVAKRCGINVSTLHFYEQKGLIKSLRNAGNQRRYQRDVLRRVSVIKAAQQFGISLQEIQQAFSQLPNQRTPGKDDWTQLSLNWKAKLDARIAALEDLRNSLEECIGCGCLSMSSCPIYNANDKLQALGKGAVLLKNIENKSKNG